MERTGITKGKREIMNKRRGNRKKKMRAENGKKMWSRKLNKLGR
jgi:hypothetical protein